MSGQQYSSGATINIMYCDMNDGMSCYVLVRMMCFQWEGGEAFTEGTNSLPLTNARSLLTHHFVLPLWRVQRIASTIATLIRRDVSSLKSMNYDFVFYNDLISTRYLEQQHSCVKIRTGSSRSCKRHRLGRPSKDMHICVAVTSTRKNDDKEIF